MLLVSMAFGSISVRMLGIICISQLRFRACEALGGLYSGVERPDWVGPEDCYGWKNAFRTVKDYIELNILEADGIISRKDIKTLQDLRLIFGR